MSAHRPRADVSRRSPVAILAAAGLLVMLAVPAAAQEPVLVVDWSTTAPSSGRVVDGSVEVSAGEGGGEFPLTTLSAPDLGQVGYVVRGQVRYRDVVGAGYLELWSVFADGQRYFSRTLATDGPQAMLTGNADWRPFELPFFLEGTAPPSRLEINVVLPDSGTVAVGPLELARLDEVAGQSPERAIGLIGAVVGTAIGLFGALLAWLVSRRRARAFVLGSMTVLSWLGIAGIGAGVVGAVLGASWSVVMLCILLGVILATVFRLGRPAARAAYVDAELRRMRAMDAG